MSIRSHGKYPRPLRERTPEERLARLEHLEALHGMMFVWLLEALERAAPAVFRAYEEACDALSKADDDADDDGV